MDIIAAKVFSMRWRKAIQAKKESRNYMPGGWLENDSAPFLGNIPDACRTYSATFIHTKRKRRRSSSASERSSFIAKSPESNVSKTSGTLISDGTAVNDKNDNMIRVDIPAQHLTSKTSPNGIISASPVSETAKLLGEKVCFGCGRMMPSYSYAYNLFSKGMSHYAPDVVEQFLPVPEVDLIEHSRPRRNTMNDFILSTSNCKNKGRSDESPPCSCPSCLLKRNKNRRKVRFSEDLTHGISRVEQWVASMESSCDSPSLEVYVPTSVESTPEPADDVTMSSPDSIAGDNVFLSDVQDKLTDSSSERSSSLAGDDEEDRQAGLQVPIVGFEVMEQRARFTVFKIHVQRTKHENWFVFRRYTDFVQLNEKLKEIFPSFRLTLPPKRWFGSNFDDHFLEERSAGLQAFLNNITGHRKVSHSQPVRQFLCLDDPPGPHDSLEESRALCESLEETVYNTRRDLQERDAKVELLEGEIAMYKAQIDALNDSLRIERQYHRLRRASANSKTPSESSLQDVETDSTSFPESDQFRIKQSTVENTNPVMVVDSNQNSEPSIKVIDKLVKKSQDGAGDASAMEPS